MCQPVIGHWRSKVFQNQHKNGTTLVFTNIKQLPGNNTGHRTWVARFLDSGSGSEKEIN